MCSIDYLFFKREMYYISPYNLFYRSVDKLFTFMIVMIDGEAVLKEYSKDNVKKYTEIGYEIRDKDLSYDHAKVLAKQYNKYFSKVVNFELRGDDLKIINEIKKYIPLEREDVWSWICYLENSFIEELNKKSEDDLE